MRMLKVLILVLMGVWFCSPVLAQEATPSLLANGGFETDANGDKTPDGWAARTSGVQWPVEEGSRFLRIQAEEPGKMYQAFRAVDVDSAHKAYELTFRVRYQQIKPGDRSWFDGRVILTFKDGEKSVGAPAPAYFKGDSKGKWVDVSRKFAVPEGARTLEIMPALFQVKSGTIDFDDFALRPIDPASIPKKVDMSSPVVPAPPAEKLPKELHVEGNQLKDSHGNPVWLQGLSVDSLQWSATGERTVPTIEVAIDQWKANCIRLAVKEDLWYGQTDQQSDGGERYRQVIDSAINTATGRGAYIVIDLHRFRAPEQKHIDFWVDVATKYKNHPGVIFELFNEPYGISWEIWRNGGPVEKPKPKGDVVDETTEGANTFESVGMQKMLDAVRATGAKNVVVIGGLDYSYDLSGILKGYAIDEKGGNGIVYSTHVYPWKSKWQEKFIDVAAHHPIFMGEVGCPEKWSDFSFIPPSQQREKLGPGATWSQDMIAVIQKHKLNWTAFSFHPRCGPMVIKDWDYTPTPYWGVFVKDALQGKQFESDKLR